MAGNVTGSVSLAVKAISNVDQSVIFNRIVAGLIGTTMNDAGIVYSLNVSTTFHLNLPATLVGLYVRNVDATNNIVLANGVGTLVMNIILSPGACVLLFDAGESFGVNDITIGSAGANVEYTWWA